MACTLVITHPNPGTDLSKTEYDANHDVVGDADDLDESATRKWAGETGADVTDAANVDAAGATMNTDADVSGNTWVLDEDDMASDSNTKVPTQQSVKKYIDDNIGWGNVDPSTLTTGNYVGPTRTATAGENLVFGDLCYLKSDGKFWKTLATAAATSTGHLCVAMETIAADATGTFLESGGYFRLDTLSFTEGCILYVGRDTSGRFRETDLTTTGDIKRIAGYCDVDDGTICFLPSSAWGVVA